MSSIREGRSSPDNSRSPVRSHRRRSRSLSNSRRSRSRYSNNPLSRDAEAVENPGNNLYVTGLSMRVSSNELERFFSKEGKVLECQLVTDPHTKESRGFGFVTMETTEDAERCIKHLNRTVLEGRLVTVEKAKRKRGRTPTPGRYQGQRDKRDGGRDIRRRSRSYSPRRRSERGRYPDDRRGRDGPRFSYDSYRRADDYSSSYRRRGAY